MIARRPFDQIIGHPRTKRSRTGNAQYRRGSQIYPRTQTENWGIELSQFRVDRIELPDTVQAEILENWKQALHGQVTIAEARAQEKFLASLESMRILNHSAIWRTPSLPYLGRPAG